MNGMGAIADEVFGNTSAALLQRGMWNNTLIIFTSGTHAVLKLLFAHFPVIPIALNLTALYQRLV